MGSARLPAGSLALGAEGIRQGEILVGTRARKNVELNSSVIPSNPHLRGGSSCRQGQRTIPDSRARPTSFAATDWHRQIPHRFPQTRALAQERSEPQAREAGQRRRTATRGCHRVHGFGRGGKDQLLRWRDDFVAAHSGDGLGESWTDIGTIDAERVGAKELIYTNVWL
jgi:hypothetical protein